MKIVLAFDKFKGSLTQTEAADAAERAIRSVLPDAEIVRVPVADGGEGTVDAFLSTGGYTEMCTVTPPHRKPKTETVTATYARFSENGRTLAVMEMASASGLGLVPKEERNPLFTSTWGTGEMLRHALDLGCREFCIGIGGSATNDGGCGMAAALGARFYRADGSEISVPCGADLTDIAKIDLSQTDKRLKECRFVACCDVDNVLYGESGAAYVFAPQKGADADAVQMLDRGLQNLCSVMEGMSDEPISTLPGGGAAGGLGAGIRFFLGGTLVSGADAVADAVGLDGILSDADLILTGEGKIDMQTVGGKTVLCILRHAKHHRVPVFCFGGAVEEDAEHALYENGASGVFALPDRPMTLSESMRDADILLFRAVRNSISAFSSGQHKIHHITKGVFSS